MENDIYDSGKKIHRAICVIPLEEFTLQVEYEDGKVIKFDMKDLLEHPLFKSLKEKKVFNSVKINGSSICWENDIDICADSLYEY